MDRTGMDRVPITDRTRLLSDKGPAMYPEPSGTTWVWWASSTSWPAPFHPQTNGKLVRYHQTLKRDANQVPYELPSDLEAAVVAFVNYYNYRRYHKALGNVTPSDVLRGRRKEILQRRREAKAQTIQRRRRHDRTLRELATPQTAPDLSGRGVSQFCWLPTRHTCDGLIRRSIHWPYKLGVCLCLGETLLQSLCVKRSWGLFRG